MHRAASLGVAGGKRAGMGVQTGIFRQERGVDVEHPPCEPVDEIRRQDPHEPGEAENVRPGGLDEFQKFRLEPRAIAPERPVIDDRGRDTHVAGFREPAGGGIVGDDQDGPRRVIAGHAAAEGDHVGSPAGNQDDHTLHKRRPR